LNGVQTKLKCKPNVKRCKRFVFAAHSPLLHPNTLKTKAIIHFQTDHILTRFVFPPLNVKTIEEAIRRYAPGIAEVFDRIYPEFYTEREKETIEELFPACESISIDYAVMEKAERIYVLPAEFGWSDLGSWGSLHSLLPKDERNNAVVGENVRMYECNNCIVHTPHLKQAVIQGLDGYIIAEKEGTLLICRLAEEQRIKEFSKA
jgi:mannose-1-phosphate guanylyltransferase